MEEESFEFKTKEGVFYNPKMTFSRSISSLAVGSIDEKLDLIDGFCASGIRGLRYATENENINSISFVDCDETALKLCKTNSKKLKIEKSFHQNSFSKLTFDLRGNFVELDPFGTPSPFIFDAIRMVSHQKTAYISATATDVAVLCGSNIDAAMKNYHSKTLNNEFTHENGLRILVNRIANVASEFNFGIAPLLSFSDQHYLKTIIKLTRSAYDAVSSLRNCGFVNFCPKCLNRFSSPFPVLSCLNCQNSKVDYSGPLWLGELSKPVFVEKMLKLNKKRKYSNSAQIDEFLTLIKNEQFAPPYHFGVHEICKFLKLKSVPKFDSIVQKLNQYSTKDTKNPHCTPTHFGPNKLKTNLSSKELLDFFKNL